MRQVITQKKVIPLLTAQLSSSINKNIDKAENLAIKVQYPYLLLLGEKDTMVDNLSALRWHEKTTSNDKHLQVLQDCYHELSKEPQNAEFFEAVLNFASVRCSGKLFGQISDLDVKMPRLKPVLYRKKFWAVVFVLYLVVGLVIAIIRRQKRLFLSWPALLVLAKRFK